MKQKIHRSVLLIALLFISLFATAQVEEFEKYSETKGVSYVYISKYMLSLAAKLGTAEVGNVKIGGVINKLASVQVISSDKRTSREKLKTDAISIAKRGKYELMMQADEDGSKTRIYMKEPTTKKDLAAIIILTYDEVETTVVVLTGKFTTSDLKGLVAMI